MASSKFHEVQQEKQLRLLHRLITHILPVQEGEENYSTALEFCAGNLNPKYHRYKDVNPREVQELYSGLSARMEQHSQLSKASRLRQQYAHLKGMGLEGVNENMDAAILLLLFSLANKPLQRGSLLRDSGVQPGPSPAEAAALDALAAREGSSSEEEEGASSSWDSDTQSLSDWEEEEGEKGQGEGGRGVSRELKAQQQQKQAGARPPDSAPAAPPSSTTPAVPSEPTPAPPPRTPEATPPPRLRAAATSPRHSASAAGRLHMPAFPPMPSSQATLLGLAQPAMQLSAARRDDLVPCLVRARLHALPFIAPEPHQCLSDQYIAHQVLNLLLNDSSTCFERCPPPPQPPPPTSTPTGTNTPHSSPTTSTPPCYRPAPGLHVPYLSPGMLHSLLCEFAEAGSQVAWLQCVIGSSSATAAGQRIQVPGIADSLHATPCCQAMLQAAASQLRAISRPLIELQQANKDAHTCPTSSPHNNTAAPPTAAASIDAAVAKSTAPHPTRAPLSLLQLREQCRVPMRRLAALHGAVHLALSAQAAAERAAMSGISGGASPAAATAAGAAVGSSSAGSAASSPGAAGSVRGAGLGGEGQLQDSDCAHDNVAAHATSVLLDALHVMLESNALMTGPLGQVLQQQLLHLFLCALTPLLDGLYTWLYDNWEDHFPEDFFVAPGVHLTETHHLFWSEAFRLMLRHGNSANRTSYGQVIAEHVDRSRIACPRFLQPIACEIFSAGKSLRLLKNSEQGGAGTHGSSNSGSGLLPRMSPLAPLLPPSRGGTAGLHRAAKQRAPLQQQFLDRLHSFLAGHKLSPATPPASSHTVPSGPGIAAQQQQQQGVVMHASGLQPSPPSALPLQPAPPPQLLASDLMPSSGPQPPLGATHGSLGYSLAPSVQQQQEQQQQGGFATRMAAAGLAHSVLRTGGPSGMGPESYEHLQPALSMHTPITAGVRSGTHGVLSAHAAGAVPRDSSSAQAGSGKRGSTETDVVGSVLEAQCSSLAAAMSRPHPSVAWEAGRGQQAGHDSIRPDMAQQLQAALLPSSLARSNASWLRPRDQVHMQLGWLLEEPCLELPPVELMLEHCLLGILRQRVEDIGQCLLSCLLSDWGLLAELSSLKNLFLMASPAAQAWADRTLSGVLFKGKPLEEHHEYELEVALQEVVAEAGQDEALPSVETISVMLDKERVLEMRAKATAVKANEPGSSISQVHPARSTHCALHSVLELEGLQFRYQPSWLMSMIGGSTAISSYNNALIFLLQIRSARMALEDARVRSWKSWKLQAFASSPHAQRGSSSTIARADSSASASSLPGMPGLPHWPASSSQQQAHNTLRGPRISLGGGVPPSSAASLNAKEEDLVMQEMSHFVSNLDQFVVDRLLCGAWMQLEQDLDQARTLDDVVRHHHAFLATLDRQAGRSTHGDTAGAWKHLVFGINKVLDQVLLFCSAQRTMTSFQTKAASSNLHAPESQVTAVKESLRVASSEFRRLHRYLLKFLGNKTHKIGGEPDLENLIMRIDFNFFYDGSFL